MVQSQRCPATVSGTKSAEATEGCSLGKAQRVGMLPQARTPAWFSTGEPFEGTGASSAVVLDPNRARLGFFLAVVCGRSPSFIPPARTRRIPLYSGSLARPSEASMTLPWPTLAYQYLPQSGSVLYNAERSALDAAARWLTLEPLWPRAIQCALPAAAVAW
jgi:hypothetical protein